VGYAQNHDQIGNRAQGERASALLSSGALHVAAALTLTAPFTPLLFMGEEWGATTPWQYFTDHDRATFAASVRDGRRAEFASFGWDPATIPDPQDPATFERSRLDWSEPAHEPHRRLLEWYRSLIRLRRQWPELGEGRLDEVDVAYDEAARWIVVRRGHIAVACNLAEQQQQLPLPGPAVRLLLASEPVVDLGPETVTAAPESVVVVELG
jgi:maltooligosyltrehalose trehalohydrolase